MLQVPAGGKPKRCAGVKGTQIAVEDVFYNMPMRLKSLRSAAEEYNRIVDVVTRYAIHFSGISFTCKKHGQSVADVLTTQSSSVQARRAARPPPLSLARGSALGSALAVAGRRGASNSMPHIAVLLAELEVAPRQSASLDRSNAAPSPPRWFLAAL